MTRWQQASWPVVFVVLTALFAGLAALWDLAAGADALGLAYSAPLWGAALSWWFVRQREQERVAAGVGAEGHRGAQRAVLRGELPADPASWSGARVLIARQRGQLHRYRWTPALFAVLGALLAVTAGQRVGYVTAAVLLVVAAVGAVTDRRTRRRLDAAERALDAAERPGSDR